MVTQPAHEPPPGAARRYPPAPRAAVVEELFGHRVEDPYRWLEDPESEPTRQWSAAQDALLDEARERWPGRDRLAARLTELNAVGQENSPYWYGGRRFHTRRTPGQEHAVLLTVDPAEDGGAAPRDAAERVLIDPVALDPAGLTTLDAWSPSHEGRLLAYQLSEGGTEESALRVMDTATGETVDGPIDRTRYSPVAWLPGGDAFYYVRRLAPELVPDGEEQYHRRVYLHRVGTDPAEDAEVFGAGLPATTYYGVRVSRDGRWLTVTASAGTAPRSDLYLADLHAAPPERPPLRPLRTGRDDQTSLGVGEDGRAYVFTDADAPRGRVLVGDPAALYAAATGPDGVPPEEWRRLLAELVPQDPEAVLEDLAVLYGDGSDPGWRPRLLLCRSRHAVSEVAVHDLATGELLHTVELPGLGSVGGFSCSDPRVPGGGFEAWFRYGDHTAPERVLRYDGRTGEVAPWAEAPGRVELPPVTVRQVTYRSSDSTEVRMFLIARSDLPPGPRPTVLYGYGGFQVSLTPGFSPGVLAWVEAGGVYAIVNLRGGLEEGEEWHRAGMLDRKQNVFDDFHAAARWLLENGVTEPGRLGISGGSNGGLLVGAAVTQRPDLYAAAVCSAPLLDMVRYERFGLGRTWNEEYGTADDPVQLGWLLAYSPYHRVRAGTAYPAVLFTVFDQDTRVDPLHARKLCAALQWATTADPDERPVLLRREKDVGHGARSVTRTVGLSTDTTCFLAARLGLDLTAGPSAGSGGTP
ncbi:prolyl oligopeptidase family serine peptidase [Peterkaempfera bronchialis]|uniref:prolyl oligopeptidase family serine peptidase n=1 Tax=Peterkaempfera bronchialis TaxID=2126346 RepID=UPI003C2FBC4D